MPCPLHSTKHRLHGEHQCRNRIHGEKILRDEEKIIIERNVNKTMTKSWEEYHELINHDPYHPTLGGLGVPRPPPKSWEELFDQQEIIKSILVMVF